MSKEQPDCGNKERDDDELFEKTWENWASRRRCESAHRKRHMSKFKEKFKDQ